MDDFRSLHLYFGDIHNHCNISYGKGALEDALENARTQLDFCSITGHADWPDMPEADDRIQHIVDFHREGFSRLKAVWEKSLAVYNDFDEGGRFIPFPGYEIHWSGFGDHTIVYKNIAGTPILAPTLPDLKELISKTKENEALLFPHHLGYPAGKRGVNWKAFSPLLSPVVEMMSMHGCSEGSESPRPFLHSMGPLDWQGTVQYGLSQGHRFGVIGNTDHHAAYPGSHGHGRTGVWARNLTRQSIWEALFARRTYALTGDRIELQFSVNEFPMGAFARGADKRDCKIHVKGGGPIDYIDLIKNNRLLKRFSRAPSPGTGQAGTDLDTKIFLEVGWGERERTASWEIQIALDKGMINGVEPRFRGMEVLSPVEKKASAAFPYRNGTWEQTDIRSAGFSVLSRGNPASTASATQGLCLDVSAPLDTRITARINGQKYHVPLERLLMGPFARTLGAIDSPGFCFHRAPLPGELIWDCCLEDRQETESDFYYVRVRQKNNQWAWSSPVFMGQ